VTVLHHSVKNDPIGLIRLDLSAEDQL